MRSKLVVVVSFLVGCQPTARPPDPIAKLDPKPPAPIVVDAAPAVVAVPADAAEPDAEDDEPGMDPVGWMMRKTFGGEAKLPKDFPKVSADGKLVAIDLSYTKGMGPWNTAQFGFYGAAGKLDEHVEFFTDKGATEAFNGTFPKPEVLAAQAAKFTQKLAGFTALKMLAGDASANTDAKTRIKLDTTTVTIDPDNQKVTWYSAKNVKLGMPRAVARPPEIEKPGHRCPGDSKLAGLWFDEAHLRMVVEFSYMGRDSCEDQPAVWQVF